MDQNLDQNLTNKWQAVIKIVWYRVEYYDILHYGNQFY